MNQCIAKKSPHMAGQPAYTSCRYGYVAQSCAQLVNGFSLVILRADTKKSPPRWANWYLLSNAAALLCHLLIIYLFRSVAPDLMQLCEFHMLRVTDRHKKACVTQA